MMKRLTKFLPAILLASMSFFLNAQDLQSRFRSHPEVYIKVAVPDSRVMHILASEYSIDRIPASPDSLIVNLIESELPGFLSLGLDYEVMEINRNPQDYAVSANASEFLSSLTAYPSYDAYESMMYAWEQNYPTLCRIYTLGTLSSGRKILAARLSRNVAVYEREPSFLYTGTIHGDETAGYAILLNLIDTLLSSYGSNPEFTRILDSTDLWINPLSNPDGTYHGGNSSVAQATRRNANSVDLNRNYPDPEDGPHPDGQAWQPETMVFMGFADTLPFTMAANFHGGAEVVNYPWDTWPQFAADNSWWELVSNEYADSCQFFGPTGYMNDFGTGVTNGYAWYTIDGGRQDYMNYFHHCREVTLEISNTKLLPANQLQNFINYNFRSVINYLKQSNYGLHGTVIDSVSGLPIRAKVFIQGHDIDSSHVWSHLPTGRFHRLLHTGNYSITFSAPGYHSKTISVAISNYQKSIISVQLVPVGIGFTEPDQAQLLIFPNPSDDRISIEFDGPLPEFGRVFDSGGRLVLQFQPSGNKNSLDLSRLPQGYYILEYGSLRRGFVRK